MKSIAIYFLKISLTGLLFLPVYMEIFHLIIYESLTDFEFYGDKFGFFGMAVLAYFFWFFPSWVLLLIVGRQILMTQRSNLMKKLYLALSIILLTGLTSIFLYIHAKYDSARDIVMIICFSCALSQLTSALIFKPSYIRSANPS
jgi:hypothetical protein